jgi:hypothetical protein
VNIGSTPPTWGVPDEEQGLKTESVSLTLTSDRKELKNGCGETTNVAFYNRRSDVEIVGYGLPGASIDDVGDTITLANAAVFAGELLVGTLYITELSVNLSNENYVQTNIKATAWDGIPST